MRKHWVTLLSMLGLAGSTVPARAQVLKGSEPNVTKDAQKKAVKVKAEGNAAGQRSKVKYWKGTSENNATQSAVTGKERKAGGTQLELNQQTLRQQNQSGNTGNSAITKGNAAVTKGNAAITKGGSNQGLTKANNTAVTKGSNAALTKGNAAITKGSNAQLTKANDNALTKAQDSALTKAKQ